jgi:hypothetical protein
MKEDTMSATDQAGATFTVTPGQLARAQAARRNGKTFSEMTQAERKHLIAMARETLRLAIEITRG